MFNLVETSSDPNNYMLQKLSYFNLMFAIAYVLIFFRESNLNFTMGVLMIVIFNWLALRSHQRDNYRWSLWHYLTGLWTMYYIAFLLYGAFNVLGLAIEYQFASKDTITFLVLTFILSASVLFQASVYFLSNLKAVRT